MCGLEVLRIVFPRDSAAARNEPIGHDKSTQCLAFKTFSSFFVLGFIFVFVFDFVFVNVLLAKRDIRA